MPAVHHHRVRLYAAWGLVMIAALIGCRDEKPPPATVTVSASADSTERYDRPNETATRSSFQAVTPAPKPTEALQPDASCVTPACHASFATSPFVHAPVFAKSCDACHEPDTGGHVYPLKRTGNDTCTFCHAVVGTRKHTHKAIDTIGCVACHDPHAAPSPKLIREISVERLCAKCHNVPLESNSHEPFLRGQCTLCHEPHESDYNNLLRGGDGPDLCFTCHQDVKQRLTTATTAHPPVVQDCSTCHDAHSTPNRSLLHKPIDQTCTTCHADVASTIDSSRFKHDAVTMDRGCANCHDAHAADDHNLLAAREDKLCLTCHDRRLETPGELPVPDMQAVLDRPFLHGPIRSGECAPCHAAHGSDNANLLTTPFPATFYAPFDIDNYALCFTCHQQELVTTAQTDALTNFRDGPRNLHFVHVNQPDKGRTCKTCHDMHGSDLPNHIAQTVPFEGSNWAMPIKFQKLDDGGSCTPGCHEAKTYRRDAAATPLADRGVQ